jgi:hypothetical protein
MSGKASEDLLANLHGALAQQFIKKLQSGECTASDLNVIRQFLKDNGIEAGDVKSGPLRVLTDSLPFAVNE